MLELPIYSPPGLRVQVADSLSAVTHAHRPTPCSPTRSPPSSPGHGAHVQQGGRQSLQLAESIAQRRRSSGAICAMWSSACLRTTPARLSSLISALSMGRWVRRRARVHLEARRGRVLRQRPHTRRVLPQLRRLVRLGQVARLFTLVGTVTRVALVVMPTSLLVGLWGSPAASTRALAGVCMTRVLATSALISAMARALCCSTSTPALPSPALSSQAPISMQLRVESRRFEVAKVQLQVQAEKTATAN